MRLVRLPGVYRPQGDTGLLAEALLDAGLRPGSAVLDVGTGTGALAIAAARAGAGRVLAVDVSRRAVLAARLNTALRGLPVRVARTDVLRQELLERFDVIVSNPPYVPASESTVPTRGRARAWDAGRDGRALLDRLCALAPALLRPRGTLLLVHSALSDVDTTLRRLRGSRLAASVVARRRQEFGPVLRGRTALLEDRGLIAPGQREEELVVVRGERPAD
ncbi:HemK2/MTQ2 family protein methyltransferase [Saccharopolyspora sp. CA-218241]|uniref:HemK2/MTQ2 family protein methyltransferase n=1 Tax=Saccharopolyspora sp. CA-218241 TaxID=3240027 RepID=UPI003D99B0B2